MAKDIAVLKVISQNLMHSNLSITDGVYGVLSEIDIREQIIGLGKRIFSDETSNIEELISLNKQILERLKLKRVAK
jgi:hypothetical protein